MKTIAMTRLLTLGMMVFLLTSCTQEQQNKISRDIQNLSLIHISEPTRPY